MKLEHVAIWTDNLERLKDYYVKYLNGKPNLKYTNPKTGLQTYFVSFESGARLEIMNKSDIPANQNDPVVQYRGIIHLAFEVESTQEVDMKAAEIQAAGFPVLRGPRITGDGYYEFETLDPDNNRLEVIAKCIKSE